jgi:hypothetical protein
VSNGPPVVLHPCASLLMLRCPSPRTAARYSAAHRGPSRLLRAGAFLLASSSPAAAQNSRPLAVEPSLIATHSVRTDASPLDSIARGPLRSATPAQPLISVRYREAACLFEILDQVSAWWPDYVEPEYRKAWIARGLEQKGDSIWFRRYATLRSRYFDRTGQQGDSAAGSAAWRAGSGLFTAGATQHADPVAAAFHDAESLDDAFTRLTTIVTPDERTFLRRFYAHFHSRTEPLTAETRAATSASREATARTLGDPAVETYLARVAALFGGARSALDSARPTWQYTALYVWWPDSDQTRASPSGRVLRLRVRPHAADTVNSADVVAHEYVHVLAAAMPVATQQALSTTILDGCAAPAFVHRRLAFVEEPIATALGNIEFRQRFLPQRFSWTRRWYNDPWVDVYARLLHPVLLHQLSTGRELGVPFAKAAAGLCTTLSRLTS